MFFYFVVDANDTYLRWSADKENAQSKCGIQYLIEKGFAFFNKNVSQAKAAANYALSYHKHTPVAKEAQR